MNAFEIIQKDVVRLANTRNAEVITRFLVTSSSLPSLEKEMVTTEKNGGAQRNTLNCLENKKNINFFLQYSLKVWYYGAYEANKESHLIKHIFFYIENSNFDCFDRAEIFFALEDLFFEHRSIQNEDIFDFQKLVKLQEILKKDLKQFNIDLKDKSWQDQLKPNWWFNDAKQKLLEIDVDKSFPFNLFSANASSCQPEMGVA